MLKIKETKNGFYKVGNGKTEFKREAIKKMDFETFCKVFNNQGLTDLAGIYEALTGKKVTKTKAKPAAKRK